MMHNAEFDFGLVEKILLDSYAIDVDEHPRYKRFVVMKKLYNDITEEEEIEFQLCLLSDILIKPMSVQPLKLSALEKMLKFNANLNVMVHSIATTGMPI